MLTFLFLRRATDKRFPDLKKFVPRKKEKDPTTCWVLPNGMSFGSGETRLQVKYYQLIGKLGDEKVGPNFDDNGDMYPHEGPIRMFTVRWDACVCVWRGLSQCLSAVRMVSLALLTVFRTE